MDSGQWAISQGEPEWTMQNPKVKIIMSNEQSRLIVRLYSQPDLSAGENNESGSCLKP